MKHARPDYDRIQDPALQDPRFLKPGSTPIGEDEPVFLLRAQDKTAAETIRHWVALNLAEPGHDGKAIQLALDHAKLMDAWPRKKVADV